MKDIFLMAIKSVFQEDYLLVIKSYKILERCHAERNEYIQNISVQHFAEWNKRYVPAEAGFPAAPSNVQDCRSVCHIQCMFIIEVQKEEQKHCIYE